MSEISEEEKMLAGEIIKDIPSNVVAVGNPCRVLREINEHDYEYYHEDRKIGFPVDK